MVNPFKQPARIAVASLAWVLAAGATGCSRDSGGAPPALNEAIDAAAPESGDGGRPSKVIIVLPDAGADAIAAAEQAVRAQVHHPDAPPVRLDLIADLLTPTLMGLAPGATAAALEKKLGAAEEKQGEVWRWPSLGVEAVVENGILQRLALHARTVAGDAKMKIFVGEVLLGTAALTQKAPTLTIRDIVHALGADGGRGQSDANVTELAWRRGSSTLFLTFDNQTLLLEAIVLEPFSQKLWDSMKALEVTPALWDLDPDEVTPERENEALGFAQVPDSIAANDVVRMRLIAAHQPNGKLLFDTLATRFLAAGESLRKLNGGRMALLRANGCAYLVLEKPDGTWEARNPDSLCQLADEPKGLARLKKALLGPSK